MNKFMKIAIDEAREGIRAGHGGPFGCVIVKDGEIVGRGHNEVVKNNDPTCHGEMMAIRDACNRLKTFDLSGCDVYTTAEPCPMCQGAILWSNAKKVYYGCSIVDTADIGFRDEVFYEKLQQIQEGNDDLQEVLDYVECRELFDEYKAIEDKTNY